MTDTCYRTEMLREIGLQIQEKTFYVDEEFCTIPYLKANRFLLQDNLIIIIVSVVRHKAFLPIIW